MTELAQPAYGLRRNVCVSEKTRCITNRVWEEGEKLIFFGTDYYIISADKGVRSFRD